MGRKAKYDIKEKKGPGRKARKQGEPNVDLMFAKKKSFKAEVISRVQHNDNDDNGLNQNSVFSSPGILKRLVSLFVPIHFIFLFFFIENSILPKLYQILKKRKSSSTKNLFT